MRPPAGRAAVSIQFRPSIEPLLVMLAIPFAFVAVVFGSPAIGAPLSSQSVLGAPKRARPVRWPQPRPVAIPAAYAVLADLGLAGKPEPGGGSKDTP